MLAERLGKSIGELDAWPAQELAEWMAFDELNGQVSEAVSGGVDPRVAVEAVWKSKEDE